MSHRSRLAVFLVLLFAALLPPSGDAQTVRPDGATVSSVSGSPSRVPGEILVKFRDAADANDVVSQGTISSGRKPGLAALLARHELQEGRQLFPRTTYRRLDQVVKMTSARLLREPQRLHEVLAALRARPEVEYAEPNVVLHALWVPNDPYYGSSGAWGQAFGDLWGLQKIEAPLAWDRSKGSGVVVAVLDTGVDATQPDLAANLWQNPGETGIDAFGRDERTNGVDDDGNGFVDDWQGWDFTFPWGGYNVPEDYFGHGTHVAGTIAAVGDNAVGLIGVAPLARIMPVKVLDSYGSGTLEEISQGILYAADNGARVINASFGAEGETPQTLVDAIAYAHDVRGVVFVAAAGNSNWDVGPAWTGFFPANIREAIAVAAFDHLDQKASFSNFGPKIDVAAPGGGDADASGTIYDAERSILSLKAAYAGSSMTGSGQLVVNGQYLRQAGTSMAAPHVAGVAALVLALHPEYSPEQVRQAIRRGADDVGETGVDTLSGWGRLNADGATSGGAVLGVHLTGPGRPFPAAVPPSVRGFVAGPGLLDWTLAYGSGTAPLDWTPIATGTAGVTNGVLAPWSTSGLFDDTYTLRLAARNTAGQAFEDRMQVEIDSVVITSPAAGTITPYRAGQTVSIKGTVAPAGFTSYYMTVRGARSGWLPNPQITLANGGLQPVVNGPLGSWDTTGVPADHYEVCVWNSGPPWVYECASVLVDPALHPGWPRNLGTMTAGGLAYAVVDHLTAADIDGNGTRELLIGYGNSVHVIAADGSDLPGWPQTIDESGTGVIIQYGPAVGDLTGDGVPEIAAQDNWGDIFVWSTDGTLLPGWPRSLANIFGHVAIDDLDGDGRSEIIVVGNAIIVVDVNGVARPGWPVTPGPSLLGAPAIGDLDGDGRKEVVVEGIWGPSPIFAYRADGSPLPGWPQNVNPGLGSSYQAFSEPVLGDLDGDGAEEIVAGSKDGKVYAFRYDGSPLPGWPQLTKPVAVNTAVIGDIDADGRPEVIAGNERSLENHTTSDSLFAWHADGTVLPGWPVHVSGVSSFFGYGAPALADLDGDGKPDILVSSDAPTYAPFALNAYRFDGAKVGDFPRPTLAVGAWPSNTVAVADLDGDGMLEMAWIDFAANLYVWDLAAPAEAKAPWPMFRHDAAHTGRVTPSQLRLNLSVESLAGGRGTVHQPGASCDNLAGPDATCVYAFAPGATVTLTAVPAAGAVFHGWGGACSGTSVTCPVTLSDYRTVTATFRPSNLAPAASPGGPYSGYRSMPLTFDGTASTDPDGDPLTYAWDFGDGATGTGVAPTHAYASLGTYPVSLVVSDGALSSAPVTTSATIINRAPIAHPGGPYVGNNATGLVVAFDGTGSHDPDGDPLTAYSWSFGDGTTGTGPTPTHAYPGEGAYTASLTVSDGLTISQPVTANVGILDVIPPAPVTGLAAVGIGTRDVRLTWTATGSNGTSGTAALYDLRYSTAPIDATSFPAATLAVGEPAPKAAGSAETFTVTGLTPGTTYYFALDVLDGAGNHSGLSNVVTGSPTLVVTIFSDNMESGSASWAVTGSDGVGGPGLWHLSSHRAASPTRAFYYGVESTLNYSTGARNQGSLTSNRIDLAGAKGSRLGFKYFLQKEASSSYDLARVYVSNNGGVSWTQLGSPLSMVGAFTEATFSLGAYDGQAVQIRFDFDTVDSFANEYEGFLVDDVSVTADSRVPLPTARPGGPYAGFKRQPIAFDGSSSSDPSGTPLGYSWNFGDGTTGTGATPTHAYQAAGQFTVTLVVNNGAANSSPASTTAVVTNRAPSAIAGGPYRGAQGLPVSFNGGGSSDPDGDTLAYSWSFGDGTAGTGVAPSHAYATAGTFNVSLTVSDGTLSSPASVTTAVVVEDVTLPAPVSNLAASAPNGRSAVLTWTATGNDGAVGTAALYDLRYSTAPIDDTTFAAATSLTAPAPKPAGGAESFTVSGLQPQTTYYFALKVRDPAGNWSALSNVASATTRPEVTVFLDDVEGLGAGWTVAGSNGAGGPALWHVTTHRVGSPTHAFYYGIDATHTYNSGATNQGTLTSPPISLAGARNVALTMQHFLQKESSATYDKATILVSKDGGLTWTLLATPAIAGSMVPLDLGLSAYEGQTIRIRFAFDTVDSFANAYEGWVIDDVRVVAESLSRQLSLTVSGVDSGVGSVTMSPPSIDCDNSASGSAPVVCRQSYETGTLVTLTAAPAPDSVFTGWTGACSGSQPTCSVTLTSDLAVGAVFRGPQTLMLTVDSLEQGSGSMHVSPPEMDCTNVPGSAQTCPSPHRVGTVVTLTATPAPDSVFAGWSSGPCAGTGPCQVTMDAPKIVAAIFRIANHPPAAAAGGPYSGVRNQAIAFDGADSSDPDGDALTYAWDFGDGSTGSGVSPTHSYATLGAFSVTLVVNDGKTSSAPSAAGVTITNRAPVANAGGPYSGTRLQAVAFDGGASSDPDGDVLSYTWDFGDGGTAVGASPTHLYASVGVFVVTLTVSDGTTASAPVTTSVRIVNVAPTVRLTGPADGSVVTLPATVVVTADALDPDGTIGKVEFYAGATLIGEDLAAPYEVAWSGSPAGAYVLTARAVDSNADAATSVPISVTLNAPPSVALTAPSAGAQFPSGSTIAVSASGADTDGAIAQVEFFRGATSLGVDTTSPYTASWTGAAVGVYTLTARATDDRGAVVTSAAITVRVTASLAPTADAEVRGSTPNTNYGTATTLAVQQGSSASSQRWSYLRVDLSAVPSVSLAKLRVFGGVSATTGTVIEMAAYPVSDTSWAETGIRWNNKPASGGTPLGSVTIVSSSTMGRWYELDVTPYLRQEKTAGRDVVTLVLKNLANSTRYVTLSSRQAATNRPEILVVP
jgi:subtilisin family serine protease/PKD repeat protein